MALCERLCFAGWSMGHNVKPRTSRRGEVSARWVAVSVSVAVDGFGAGYGYGFGYGFGLGPGIRPSDKPPS